MFRSWKSLLIGAVVAGTVLTGAAEANAHWGLGAWGCYRPALWQCGSPCYSVTTSPCGSSGEWYRGPRPGPIRRAIFGPCRWYYTGWGCPIGCRCSDCCETTCCSEVTVTTSKPAVTGTPTPAQPKEVDTPPTPTPPTPTPPNPTPPTPTPPPGFDGNTAPQPPGPVDEAEDGIQTAPLPGAIDPGAVRQTPDNSGLLTIWVPFDAKVYVNGVATESQGSRREYVSHGLAPGFVYRYEIRATAVRNGQLLEERRTVMLSAGGAEGVAFGFNIAPVEGLVSR